MHARNEIFWTRTLEKVWQKSELLCYACSKCSYIQFWGDLFLCAWCFVSRRTTHFFPVRHINWFLWIIFNFVFSDFSSKTKNIRNTYQFNGFYVCRVSFIMKSIPKTFFCWLCFYDSNRFTRIWECRKSPWSFSTITLLTSSNVNNNFSMN